jgi:hypothetical protein
VKCFVAKLPKKTRGNARSVKVPTSLLAATRRTAQRWFAKPILRAMRKALSVPIAKAGFAKAADYVLVVSLVRNAGWKQKNVETAESVCATSATRGASRVVILNAVVRHCATVFLAVALLWFTTARLRTTAPQSPRSPIGKRKALVPFGIQFKFMAS